MIIIKKINLNARYNSKNFTENDFGKNPDDLAANYYFEKAVKYVVEGVAENWSGVEEMVSK